MVNNNFVSKFRERYKVQTVNYLTISVSTTWQFQKILYFVYFSTAEPASFPDSRQNYFP
uniref:Uncharacterized protein n=1 Tax=Manihot esculenta TaxID=3983 RepID=A0A2C9UEV5_MANES